MRVWKILTETRISYSMPLFRPEVRRLLDRIAWGLSGVEEARLLGELLDSFDDQIEALKLKIKTVERKKK